MYERIQAKDWTLDGQDDMSKKALERKRQGDLRIAETIAGARRARSNRLSYVTYGVKEKKEPRTADRTSAEDAVLARADASEGVDIGRARRYEQKSLGEEATRLAGIGK